MGIVGCYVTWAIFYCLTSFGVVLQARQRESLVNSRPSVYLIGRRCPRLSQSPSVDENAVKRSVLLKMKPFMYSVYTQNQRPLHLYEPAARPGSIVFFIIVSQCCRKMLRSHFFFLLHPNNLSIKHPWEKKKCYCSSSSSWETFCAHC